MDSYYSIKFVFKPFHGFWGKWFDRQCMDTHGRMFKAEAMAALPGLPISTDECIWCCHSRVTLLPFVIAKVGDLVTSTQEGMVACYGRYWLSIALWGRRLTYTSWTKYRRNLVQRDIIRGTECCSYSNLLKYSFHRLDTKDIMVMTPRVNTLKQVNTKLINMYFSHKPL